MSALDKLAATSGDELLAFLKTQRWFAAKGAAPTEARVIDAVVMPWGDGRFAIARVGVTTDTGTATYQLPVSSDALDATSDEEFRRGLVNALVHGAEAKTGNLRWVVDSSVAQAPSETGRQTRLGSAEQSNTSIIVDDKCIIKLFRGLRAGIQPDLEVTHFLTSYAGFRGTPRLIASARFVDDAGEWATAMMQELVPGAVDAWTYALERGKKYFAAPKTADPTNDFLGDARRLGVITRDMHDALASEDDSPSDFAPEAIEPDDLDRWIARTQRQITESLALLERAVGSPSFPKERVAEAQALIRRRDHYLGWIAEIDDALGEDVGMRSRVHGDYHLGQVLRASNGDFKIIDFEGEPSKPLEERREKTSPLRDVAGMLRSFAYAAATLASSVEKQLDMPTRELRIARWERDVRAAFLDGYLAADDDEGILPEDTAHVRKLIALFEAEKAFYELAYEINNRPAWIGIPLRGISKLFVG